MLVLIDIGCGIKRFVERRPCPGQAESFRLMGPLCLGFLFDVVVENGGRTHGGQWTVSRPCLGLSRTGEKTGQCTGTRV